MTAREQRRAEKDQIGRRARRLAAAAAEAEAVQRQDPADAAPAVAAGLPPAPAASTPAPVPAAPPAAKAQPAAPPSPAAAVAVAAQAAVAPPVAAAPAPLASPPPAAPKPAAPSVPAAVAPKPPAPVAATPPAAASAPKPQSALPSAVPSPRRVPEATSPPKVAAPAGGPAPGAPKLATVPAAPPPKGPATVTSLPSPRTPPPAAAPAPAPAPGQKVEQFPFSGAGPARMKRRHWGLILSFFVTVCIPVAIVAWYLWTVAIDQYESRVGFSVQREESGSAIELLGGITELSGNSSTDTDILYKFIQSRELVATLDARIDLESMFTRPEDPMFSMPENPTIEDLQDHWLRMVSVYYDTASYLIEVRALAFTPGDAERITEEVYAESSLMLNGLSTAARQDATRYAREELDEAQSRLRTARQELTAFRVKSRIVDPAADVQGRMGLLNNLLAQQAEALIELDIIETNAAAGDPRVAQARLRVEVIETRINAERAEFGEEPAAEDERYADLVAEFEALSVDLEFAQQAYLRSLATYDAAVAEAQRKSRYLVPYLKPTVAQRSEFPQRWLLFGLFGGFIFAAWAIAVLVYYTLRDRV